MPKNFLKAVMRLHSTTPKLSLSNNVAAAATSSTEDGRGLLREGFTYTYNVLNSHTYVRLPYLPPDRSHGFNDPRCYTNDLMLVNFVSATQVDNSTGVI